MSTWIKCSDRMPEECEHVLIYCPAITCMTVAYLIYGHGAQPVCFYIVDFDEYDQIANLDEITHWVQLPKPPKG